MSLVEFSNITATINKKNILTNFNLTIDSKQSLGLKMTEQEGKLLFELLSQKALPTVGKVDIKAHQIMFKNAEDGLYEKLTVKAYLKIFEGISDKKIKITDVISNFFLVDAINSRIETLTIDQKELVHLLRVYIIQPDIVFIESPLRNLSVSGTANYLKAISFMRQQLTIVFVSPSMEELRLVSTNIYQYVNENLERISLNSTKIKLVSRHNDETTFFTPDEIDFVESINSVSNLFVRGKYYPISLTMDELMDKLSDEGFYRCHRSYLVKLDGISQIVSYAKNSYTLILKNNEQSKIPLSRTKLESIKKLISTTQA